MKKYWNTLVISILTILFLWAFVSSALQVFARESDNSEEVSFLKARVEERQAEWQSLEDQRLAIVEKQNELTRLNDLARTQITMLEGGF